MALDLTTSFICEICKLEHKTYSAFIQHVRLGCSHKVKSKGSPKFLYKSITCEMCKEKFENQSSMRKHINHSCLQKYRLKDKSEIKNNALECDKVRRKAVGINWNIVSWHKQKRTETCISHDKKLSEQKENGINVKTDKDEPINKRLDCLACGKKCSSNFDLKCHRIIHQDSEKVNSESKSFYSKTPTADQKIDNVKKRHPVRLKMRDSDDVTADVLSNDLDFKDLTTSGIQIQVQEFVAINGIVMNKVDKNVKPVRFNPNFFRCIMCQKVVRTAGFKLHMETHYGEKRFQCLECKKTFRLKAFLQKHMLMHSEDKKFECGLCRQKFKTAPRLKEHMTRAHISETRYLCDVCGKRFSNSAGFRAHRHIHLRDKHRYLCDICGNSFTDRSTLRVHKWIHSETKPFKCSICGQSFGQRQHLTRHFRIHTGEKRYQCNICNKSLTNAKGLEFHLNLHTGEKPYNCEICGRRFAAKSNLHQHRKTHKVTM